jgi:p-toluenesulfonate methyl-monooxygenase reductase component TsaB
MSDQLELIVSGLRAVARDVIQYELRGSNGQCLPKANAGSHIEFTLPNGFKRQYSLVNAIDDSMLESYVIAVGWDSNSRGGSVWIHEKLKIGQKLQVSTPRNLFEMRPADEKVLLIAGGIGITPIFAMAQSCAKHAKNYELWVCARSASRMAYLEELKALVGEKLRLHFDDEAGGPMKLETMLKTQHWDALYACGPAPMLDAVVASTQHWTPDCVHLERFKGAENTSNENTSFELELKHSGLITTVEPTESVLDAMSRIGVDYPWSCREGVCGTCEAKVLEGNIEHKDFVLSPSEREEKNRMMVCVSRCLSQRLVLDI